MSAVGACRSAGNAEQSLLRVRCEVDGLGRDYRILEMDPRRMFVESFVPPIAGSRVKLRFCLPNGHQVSTLGVVAYHQFTVGFGVELTELSQNDRAQIVNLVG